jgi:hypothetical protein
MRATGYFMAKMAKPARAHKHRQEINSLVDSAKGNKNKFVIQPNKFPHQSGKITKIMKRHNIEEAATATV